MKKVCIINTGGTIGMVRTENGFAPKQGFLLEELKRINDLSSMDMPNWDLIEFDPILDSSNVTYSEWNKVAVTIKENYDAYDGFVVLHGTDTMAYSASALSFMLRGLDKPVVFTGSQIPLCELRSDGEDNLVTSMLIAADGVVNEVSLYFSNKLMRGNRAIKESADDLIAFASPNYPELASVGIDIKYDYSAIAQDNWLEPGGARKSVDADSGSGSAALEITKIDKYDIGVIKLFPGIHFELFAPIVTEGLDGLVLETFGSGNIPNYDDSLPPLIKRAIDNGTIVVVCTQSPQGTVRLGAYETSSALAKAGAVSGWNMTTEATVTKLAYLLSLGLDKEKVRALMEENIRGELSR